MFISKTKKKPKSEIRCNLCYLSICLENISDWMMKRMKMKTKTKQIKNNCTMHTNTHLSIETIENKTKRHMNENQTLEKKIVQIQWQIWKMMRFNLDRNIVTTTTIHYRWFIWRRIGCANHVPKISHNKYLLLNERNVNND